MITSYLTEQNLGQFLRERFRCDISTPRLKFSEGLFLPDYVIEDLKLILEYDGPRHYTQATTAVRDFKKLEIYNKHGYNLISIPYFVQFDERVVNDLFSNYKEYINDLSEFNNFPHGFVSDKVILPCDFCSLGVDRFIIELTDKFGYIKDDIITSLYTKINNKRTHLEVFPRHMYF